jgi:hypothetical protein
MGTTMKNSDFYVESNTMYRDYSCTTLHPNSQIFPLQIVRISLLSKQTYFKMASVLPQYKWARILKIGRVLIIIQIRKKCLSLIQHPTHKVYKLVICTYIHIVILSVTQK